MIKKCYFEDEFLDDSYNLITHNEDSLFEINLEVKKEATLLKIEFFIEFDQPIKAWRNHDYKWADMNKRRVSNDYSPKILVLNDNTYVISHKNHGLWEYNTSKKNTIKWILKHPQLTPLFQYDTNGKRIFRKEFKSENFNLKLILTDEKVPEFSRSLIPFSPILCFTDHCDFDTNDALEEQLSFFSSNDIRVTKGFFLNHFSKREDNSSFERDKKLIEKFISSNHELAYHSLTQSLRDIEGAKNEFYTFLPPFKELKTWIDHGFQPYNYTTINRSQIDEEKWSKNCVDKNISNLWTYVDSGTGGKDIFNQINPDHFSLNRIFKNSKGLGKSRLRFLIRSLVLFSGNEKLIYKYKILAKELKKIILSKKIESVFTIIPLLLSCCWEIAFRLASSKKRKEIFYFAAYCPLIFEAKIGSVNFNMFQTLEITDFENTFCKSNLDHLCAESGTVIAHTYFSSTLAHQNGRLFNGNVVSKKNQANFSYLKQLINNKSLWNPTVSELIRYHNLNLNLEYAIDKETKTIIVKNAEHAHIRYIEFYDKL